MWKRTTCRLGRGSLHTLISGEPDSKHAAHELPGGCSTLSRADGLPLRCKGQRVYWAQILWVSEFLKRGTFILCRLSSWSNRTEFPFRRGMVFCAVVTAPGVCHPGLEQGPCFTDGRGDSSVLLRAFDYRTWFWAWGKVWNVENCFSDSHQLVSNKSNAFSMGLVKRGPNIINVGYFINFKEFENAFVKHHTGEDQHVLLSDLITWAMLL